MNLKKIGKVFTSKSVGTGPSSYKKRIYRAAVSQRLRNTALIGPLNPHSAGRNCILETDSRNKWNVTRTKPVPRVSMSITNYNCTSLGPNLNIRGLDLAISTRNTLQRPDSDRQKINAHFFLASDISLCC